MDSDDYEKRVEQQVTQYANVENIHDLPEIFHYWSNRYLRPLLNQVVHADSIPEFFANGIIQTARNGATVRVVSLGSGDGSVELSIAKHLVDRHFDNFHFQCLEVSPILTARARAAVEAAALGDHIEANQTDLNAWAPVPGSIDVVMANHSLHHMVELEHIFDTVCSALRAGGLFVTSDKIGRNGHMRWPEVKLWMDQLWKMLPDRLKMNRSLNRFEAEFLDWDCSHEGFEGIRAQDILPLLMERFNFDVFLAFGGLLDVFIDRAYGHNFDASSDADKGLIDFLSYLNDRLIDLGDIKPTSMFAVMRPKIHGTRLSPRHFGSWTPEFCVRQPN